MTAPNERARAPREPAGNVSRLIDLLASFLRAGGARAGGERSPAHPLAQVRFEHTTFWLAAPNVLNARGVPLIGFTLHNGSSLFLTRVDVDAALYVDQARSPAARGMMRIRFNRANGLAPGGTFSGVASMLMLQDDAWTSSRVRAASQHRVELTLKTAYDERGEPIAGR